MDEALRDEVCRWQDGDPDPDDRDELAALLEAQDEAALRARFAGPLTFGTAGLRGTLRAGPAGMNTAVVRRAASGLAAHLGAGATLVVGYDARRRSEAFAHDAAAVAAGAGLRALLLPRALPTPLLAFAVRHLGADAGAMVTASHNPPQDNGLKVLLGGPGDEGAQVVEPTDAAVEAAIAAAPAAAALRLGRPERLGDEVVEAYVEAVAALVPAGAPREVTIAYTAMHGVGRDVLLAVLERAGFPTPAVEPTQAEPDGAFPTVAYPNPEEPGAMDRVVALGLRVGADVTLANDPDADRLAVAVGDRVLTGDEVGALLGDAVLARAPRGALAATTIASSTLLRAIAAAHGARHAETLTGFKWLMRAGAGLAYAYEDALGYSVAPDLVRDKDGIAAALAVAGLAAELRAQGRTLLDRLDDLARAHGVHATRPVTVRVEDVGEIAAAMDRLRAAPAAKLGGEPVTGVRDLLAPGDVLPHSDVLVLALAAGRVVVRPSGTEPKLKAYLEAVEPAAGGDVGAARRRAEERLDALAADLRAALGPT